MSQRQRSTGHGQRAGSPRGNTPPGETLALFSDCLIIGLLTTITALGIVTAYPGLVAACALIHDRAEVDTPVGPLTYGKRLRQVAASGVAVFVAPIVVTALLVLDLVAVLAGVPGGRVLAIVLFAAATSAILLSMRMAGVWRPGLRWPTVARSGLDRIVADPGGDALLLLVAAAATALATLAPLILVLVPGPLALAIAAVETRTRTG